jgi:hypothetical protein
MRRLALCGLLAAVVLAAAGCAGSGRTREEVRAARAYRPGLFAIFPASRGKRACRIPFRSAPFAPTRHVPGVCETRGRTVRAFDAKGFIDHQEVAIVSFTERWHWGPTGKALSLPRHTWWVYERLGSGVQVLGSCDLEPGTPYAHRNDPNHDPCRSPSRFGPRTREAQLEAAFAAQGIHLRRDPQPGWPHGNVGLEAPGQAYVEMQLLQPSPMSTPPLRLAPARYGFTRQGNVEVWWSQPYRLRAKGALDALK